jgi:hemin uptake protein HemP
MNLAMAMNDSVSQNHQKTVTGAVVPSFTSQEKIHISADLLGQANSALIDHRGVIYTLRLTQFGKLILTK